MLKDGVKLKKTSIRRVAGEYGLPFQTLRENKQQGWPYEVYDKDHFY